MFDFDAVIDCGTYDDFKECVLAVVYLKPLLQLRIASTPVHSTGTRRLRANWTIELHQDLQAMHGIQAERVLVRALTAAAQAAPRRQRR